MKSLYDGLPDAKVMKTMGAVGEKLKITRFLDSASWWVKNKGIHRKAIEEMKKKERKNISVTIREPMHEKAAIIDGKISYMGSVNMLSSREGSSDYMLRFENPDLTKSFMIFLETLAERSEEEEKTI